MLQRSLDEDFTLTLVHSTPASARLLYGARRLLACSAQPHSPNDTGGVEQARTCLLRSWKPKSPVEVTPHFRETQSLVKLAPHSFFVAAVTGLQVRRVVDVQA